MAKQLTELEKQIINIAVMNPSQFIELIGEDALLRMKACLLRRSGNTYGQISTKLDKPRQTVVSIISRDCKC